MCWPALPRSTFIYPEPESETDVHGCAGRRCIRPQQRSGYCRSQVCSTRKADGLPCTHIAMGKHLSERELDQAQTWKSQGAGTTADTHDRLVRARAPTRDRGPSLRAAQRALEGATFRRAKVETRSRKEVLTPKNLRALERAARA